MADAVPTILIIDNDEGMVAALTTRLERSGYRCLGAGSGAQGLAIFQAIEVHLVISDLNMPAGDGITLATTLRQSSDVPIIIVTGFRAEYHRDLRAIGNVTIIEKPFDSNELIDLVEADLVLSGCALPVTS